MGLLKSRKGLLWYAVCILISISMALPAVAEDTELEDEQFRNLNYDKIQEVEDDDGLGLQFSANGNYVAKSEFNNSGAAFTQGGIGFLAAYKMLSFEFQQTRYSWTDTEKLSFGRDKSHDPWKYLNSMGVGLNIPYEINDTWFLAANLGVSSNFETTITSDSMEYSAMGLVGYAITDNITLSVGGGVGRNGVKTEFMPYIGLQYADDTWLVALGFPEAIVEYTLNEEWTFRAEYGSTGGRYKLSSTSAAERNGFADIEGSFVGLYADWSITENMLITVGPEYHFARSMRLYDKDGHKVGNKSKPKNAFGGTVNLSYTF